MDERIGTINPHGTKPEGLYAMLKGIQSVPHEIITFLAPSCGAYQCKFLYLRIGASVLKLENVSLMLVVLLYPLTD